MRNTTQCNLKLLFASKNHSLLFSEFKDKQGKKLEKNIGFSKIMKNKELINIELDDGFSSCNLTKFGLKVSKNGGWLEHLKKLEKEEKQTNSEKIILLESKVKNNRKKFKSKILIAFLIISVLIFLKAII